MYRFMHFCAVLFVVCFFLTAQACDRNSDLVREEVEKKAAALDNALENSQRERFIVYKSAAEQGDVDFQLIVGGMYAEGLGVTQDDVEATMWFRKAAEQGNADGQYILGNRYRDGKGIGQSYSEAIKWYRLAAKNNSKGAQKALEAMEKQESPSSQ